LFSIFSDTPNETAQKVLFGPKGLNHKLFRPRFYNMDDYTNYEYVELNDRYNNSDLPEYIGNEHMTQNMITNHFKTSIIPELNYDNFVAINSDGYVVPVKRWIIEMTWEMHIMQGNNNNKPIKKVYKNKASA
jgi:hypothetical protein